MDRGVGLVQFFALFIFFLFVVTETLVLNSMCFSMAGVAHRDRAEEPFVSEFRKLHME